MLKSIFAAAAVAMAAIVPPAAHAQAAVPTPARPAAAAGEAGPREDWVTVRNTMVIKAPVEKLWAVAGGFCDLPRNLGESCRYIKGTGGLGTVRETTGGSRWVKVGEGRYNYSFFYTAGSGGPPVAAQYHTNVEAVPSANGKTSTLIVTLVYDQSVLPNDAARAARRKSHIDGFAEHFRATKELAERN